MSALLCLDPPGASGGWASCVSEHLLIPWPPRLGSRACCGVPRCASGMSASPCRAVVCRCSEVATEEIPSGFPGVPGVARGGMAALQPRPARAGGPSRQRRQHLTLLLPRDDRAVPGRGPAASGEGAGQRPCYRHLGAAGLHPRTHSR